MYLAYFDYISNNGSSPFHKALPLSKIILSIFMLIFIISTVNLIKLCIMLIFVIVLFLVARIPLGRIGHLAIYPAIFSAIFALFKIGESKALALAIVLKSVDAALVMLFLFSTTPYIQILSLFSVFMPPILVDIFIFTYRTFFILVDSIANTLKSMRIRGGYHRLGLGKNLANMARVLGVIILHSFEMSERMYRIYMLRGYNGGIKIGRAKGNMGLNDLMLLSLSLLIFIGMVMTWKI